MNGLRMAKMTDPPSFSLMQVGRYASDRTREALDQATLRLAKAGRKPPPPENGWGDVGRRLGSISAYELQLIDEKVWMGVDTCM